MTPPWSRRAKNRALRSVVLLVLIAFALYWLSDQCHAHHVDRVVEEAQWQRGDHLLPTIARGQSFFYKSEEQHRLSSFEPWRPKHWVGKSRIDWHEREDERVFVVMLTSSSSVWHYLPIQLLSTFRRFTKFAVFGEWPDLVGGIEVQDAFAKTDATTRYPQQFMPHISMARIREFHVNLAPEDAASTGVNELARYVVLPAIYTAFQASPSYDWYLIVDDQTSLVESSIRSALRNLDPHSIRSFGGGSFILSSKLMQRAFQRQQGDIIDWAVRESKENWRSTLADYLRSVGLQINPESSKNLLQSQSVNTMKFNTRNWCESIGSIGHNSPREIEVLAEYTALKGKSGSAEEPLLYSDLYLDFIKPYLRSDAQPNWDNGANDLEFSLELESENKAYESWEACQQACEDVEQCVMFRHDNYLKYCGLGVSSVTLGGPVVRHAQQADQQACEKWGVRCQPRTREDAMTSQWLIPRIRKMRSKLKCDALFDDPGSEGTAYGALDQVEGWWYRAIEEK